MMQELFDLVKFYDYAISVDDCDENRVYVKLRKYVLHLIKDIFESDL